MRAATGPDSERSPGFLLPRFGAWTGRKQFRSMGRMVADGKFAWRWAWLAVGLAGLVPFASDMARNFPLFSLRQLVISFAAVVAGTSAVFAAAWGAVALARAAPRRAGRDLPAVFERRVCAWTAAVVFALFLYDSNMVELRQGFGWSRPAAAAGVLALLAMYGTVAAWLGPKRTSALLAAVLAFRLAQAGLAVSDAAARGDALMPPGEIRVYEKVTLADKPNIYCLCLESYHSFAAMQELYSFANADFRSFLETNGFAVAEGVYANYWHTMSSLHSFLRMGHHYAAGTFGIHDSLHARGFVSGSGTYYNPVLRILKRNGYSIRYLLPADYYYRPGAGLVDYSLLQQSWPLAPLKVSLPRFIGHEPETNVSDYDRKVAAAIAAWPRGQPAFFLMKMGVEHADRIYDYRTERAGFTAQYVRDVVRSNAPIEVLCRQIVAQDPGAIVILLGDHGAQSYKVSRRGFQETAHLDGVPAERIADDMHAVLLAIRWGQGRAAAAYPFRSLANVMRFVFYRLSGDEALLATAVPDDAYLLENGVLCRTVEDGKPLPEWKPFPWGAIPGR